jgi:hypothetical protein
MSYPVTVHNRVAPEGNYRLGHGGLFLIVWNGGNSGAVLLKPDEMRMLPFDSPPPVGTSCWLRVTSPTDSYTHDSKDNFVITVPPGSARRI